jgi:hypothetical protein
MAGSLPPLHHWSVGCFEISGAHRVYVQLKSDSLEGLRCALHDLLASECAASETDLVWAGMCCQPWAEVIVTTQDLKDTRREELLSELAELQIAVGREGRGLDDDRVAGEQRGADFAAHEMDWEVPGDCDERSGGCSWGKEDMEAHQCRQQDQEEYIGEQSASDHLPQRSLPSAQAWRVLGAM